MNIPKFAPELTFDYNVFFIVASIFLAAFVSYKSYPIIIRVSRLKRLMAKPEHRSVHKIETPNLGGIGIFLGVITVLTFLGAVFNYNNLLCLIGALVVLFFTGLKDDLVNITPKQKLLGQTIAALCVIAITDLRIESFHGLFGIEALPYMVSVVFSLFVFIIVINAFNLIDGVDGLAGSIGITASLLFGVYFYVNNNDSLLIISLSLVGALSSFLFFNFSKKYKIFMGDTGSMVLGFLMAYQGISFIKINGMVESSMDISNAPLFILALFSFPLMDTLRVFIIRIHKGRSPFSADKNHIHHDLLSLGFKHWQIALTASLFSLFMVFLSFQYNTFGANMAFMLLFLTCLSFFALINFSKKAKGVLKKTFNHKPKKTKPSLPLQLRGFLNAFF